MKKLKLQALKFGTGEILTREQLKNVLGGDDPSGGSGGVWKCSNSTCILVFNGNNESGQCAWYLEGQVTCFCKTAEHSTPTHITTYQSHCLVPA